MSKAAKVKCEFVKRLKVRRWLKANNQVPSDLVAAELDVIVKEELAKSLKGEGRVKLPEKPQAKAPKTKAPQKQKKASAKKPQAVKRVPVKDQPADAPEAAEPVSA